MDERIRYRDSLLKEKQEITSRLDEIYQQLEELGCPGPTGCHGCQTWCDLCGDVSTVCSAHRCDRHRCTWCHAYVSSVDEILDGQARCFQCQLFEWHFHFVRGWACLGRAIAGL